MPSNLLQESFGISKSVLSTTNISASDVKSGIKFINPDGVIQTGTFMLSGNAAVSDVMSGKTFYSNSFTKQPGSRTIYSKGSVFVARSFIRNPTSFTVNNVHALLLEIWRMGSYPTRPNISCTSGNLSETNQDNRRYIMISNISGSTTINITDIPSNEYWMVGFGFRMS